MTSNAADTAGSNKATSPQVSMRSTANDSIIAPLHGANTVPSTVLDGDRADAINNEEEIFDEDREWEDEAPAHLEYRGKQDRPNIGAEQGTGDGGKKKPVKKSEDRGARE